MSETAEIMEVIKEAARMAAEEMPTGDPFLDDQYINGFPAVPPQPYYKFLWLLAKTFEPKLSVELGTWRAFASSHICGGSPPGSTTVTIDIHREDKEAQKYVQEVVVPHFGGKLVYINAWTWDAVPVVKARGVPIDLLYIDAWHHLEYVKREWDLYTPLMNKQSIIFCDDLFDADGATIGMVEFWKGIEQPKFFFTPEWRLHEWIPMGVVLWNW